MRNYLQTVTFKVTPEHWRALETRGAALGMSPHQMARDITERALSGNDEALLENLNFLAERIGGTEEQLKQLRGDIAADLARIVRAIQEKIPKASRAGEGSK